MTDIERLTVRIDKASLKKLQDLVDSGKFHDVSEAVRVAIERLIADVDKIEETKDVPIELLVEDKPVDFDQAVKNAVNDYIRNKIKTR